MIKEYEENTDDEEIIKQLEICYKNENLEDYPVDLYSSPYPVFYNILLIILFLYSYYHWMIL